MEMEAGTSTTTWTIPTPLNRFGFDIPTMVAEGNEAMFFSRVDTGARFADVNHDGYADIVWAYHTSHTNLSFSYGYDISDVYINNQHNGWATTTGWALPSGFLFGYDENDTGSRIADVNGDGLPDLLQSHGSVFLNTGSGWAQASTSWNVPVYFGTDTGQMFGLMAGTQLVDVNGDGLTDIVQSESSDRPQDRPSISVVYLNTGSGWALASSWSVPVPILRYVRSYGTFIDSTRFIDVNSDGLNDIIRSSYENSTEGDGNDVYINTGKGWTYDSSWSLPTPFKFHRDDSSNPDAGVAEMDLDGDNAIDFVRSGPNYSNGSYSQVTGVYLNKGKPVDLLASIQYPEGAKITATYSQSELAHDGSAQANPSLSINLNSVASLAYDDQFSSPYSHTVYVWRRSDVLRLFDRY